MTEFEYRPEDGVVIIWMLTIAGYDDEIDGDWGESLDSLSEVEVLIENLEDAHRDDSGAALVRVHGAHGWREFEWSDGAVHRYEWSHEPLDLRCDLCRSPDADLYMVTDELWASSGLTQWECFRCLEKAIGRQLVPADFQPGHPDNNDNYHGPELRQRMGAHLTR